MGYVIVRYSRSARSAQPLSLLRTRHAPLTEHFTGRIQETPGEDPFVSGAYAEAFVRGMQEGADPRYLKTSATCKHWAAYSLEQWEGMDRYHFDARVTDEDFAEFYAPAFQQCVEAGRASALMCSTLPRCARCARCATSHTPSPLATLTAPAQATMPSTASPRAPTPSSSRRSSARSGRLTAT